MKEPLQARLSMQVVLLLVLTNHVEVIEQAKGMVLAKEGEKIKLIHFGDSSMGHNYSPEARRSFKARHARNIAKGKMSAAYWADKVYWAGPSGSKKSPPKSQKYTRGINRRK